MSSKVKDSIREMLETLPDDCTWDDAMYQLYVRQKIADGLRAAEEGRTVSHEEVFVEFSE